jgi:predicted CXXCH cytochrome family protein
MIRARRKAVLLFGTCFLLRAYSQGYTDPKACASCHAGIAQAFRQTGMGRSFFRPQPANTIEDYDKENHYFHAASDTHYVMLRREGKYYQRRYQVGFDGREVNVDEKEIAFVLGSGDLARTYLSRTTEGTLVELPLGWYAEKGGHWGMSPGYDSAQNPAAQREIGYDCVFCHNAYPRAANITAKDRFGDRPVLPRDLPEGIDCQRCHGAGQRHVAAAQVQGNSADNVRRAIVNPARLSADRQFEICMQCHLEVDSLRPTLDFKRYGASYFSYSPANTLSSFLLYFDGAGAAKEDRYRITGTAFRLRQSACFLKSEGKLQCTTCHDPHGARHGAKTAESYNGACTKCHTGQFQTLVSAGSHTNETDCVGCHMTKQRTQDVVHAVTTDHLIQRKHPNESILLAEMAEGSTGAVGSGGKAILVYPAKSASTAEDRLVLAVAQMRVDPSAKDAMPQLARLLKSEPSLRGDPYFELAEARRNAKDLAGAVESYREALRRDPQYLAAVIALGATLNQLGDHTGAAEVLRGATRWGQQDARLWDALGRAEIDRDQIVEASAALEKAVSLNPDLASPHVGLGIARAREGKVQEADAQFREAIRISPNSGEGHFNLANLLIFERDFPQAAREFEHAVRAEPNRIEFRLKYAGLLYTVRQNLAAKEQVLAALGSDPESAEAHHILGNIMEQEGDTAGALREYQAAVKLQPQNNRAQLDLGAVLVQSGDKKAGAEHLRIASTASDDNVRRIALQLLAEIQEK